MPIQNLTRSHLLPFRVFIANNFLTRLSGFLGLQQVKEPKAIFIKPCSAIHTFGMKETIDVVFLDEFNTVIRVIHNLGKNQVIAKVQKAKSVLEMSTGVISQDTIKPGDRLKIKEDSPYPISFSALSRAIHWPANLLVASLWGIFIYRALQIFLARGGVVDAGILVFNTIIALLFLTRRESSEFSRRVIDWVIPFLTVALSMVLIPQPMAQDFWRYLSNILQILGIIAMVISLSSLGRSFGIVPANRQIKISGAYKIVRHPLYTSEMIFYIGFVLGNFSERNLIKIIAILAGQIWRAVSEEKILIKDSNYQTYVKTVVHKFIPGIY